MCGKSRIVVGIKRKKISLMVVKYFPTVGFITNSFLLLFQKNVHVNKEVKYTRINLELENGLPAARYLSLIVYRSGALQYKLMSLA